MCIKASAVSETWRLKRALMLQEVFTPQLSQQLSVKPMWAEKHFCFFVL